MPRARYSRIKQAEKAFNQLEELIQYEKGKKPSIGPGIGQGTDLGEIQPIFVIPFNRELPDKFFARTRGRANLINQWSGAFGDHLKVALDPSTEKTAPLERWSPAKVKVVTGGANKSVATSGITGRQYLKYNKQSRQLSFGHHTSNTGETERQAFTTIRQILAGTEQNANFIHIPEKV